MSESVPSNAPIDSAALPAPKLERMRWPFPWIWLVPVAAIGVAVFYFYDRHRQRGPEITIQFASADGIKPDETPLDVLGVQVGRVIGSSLSSDKQHVLVKIELNPVDASIAVDGTAFWIVRPDISSGNITGLSTVINGPYIEALPGGGKTASNFVGRSKAPVMVGDGIRVILHADRLPHLVPNAPVYFRGIQVGAVQDIRLNSDATGVNATVFIWNRYTGLLRPTSVFWTSPGADVKGGIFSGFDLKLNSLKSLISGGVSFATPDEGSTEPARDGTAFKLHDEPKDAWMQWSPRLKIPADTSGDESNEPPVQQQPAPEPGAK